MGRPWLAINVKIAVSRRGPLEHRVASTHGVSEIGRQAYRQAYRPTRLPRAQLHSLVTVPDVLLQSAQSPGPSRPIRGECACNG